MNMNINDPTTWPLPVRLAATLVDAAAAYATAGVAVFPCVPGGKRPLTEHGFYDASADPDQVAAWWGRFPTANIGIPTGNVVDVLDVDVHAAGTGFPILRTLHQQGLIGGWGRPFVRPRAACTSTTRRILPTRCRRGREGRRMWTSVAPADTSSPHPPRSPQAVATAAMR